MTAPGAAITELNIGAPSALDEVPVTDPFETAPATPAIPPRGAPVVLPQNAAQAEQRDALAGPSARMARGITRDDGSWVELTDELAAIDDRVRLDGLQVAAAIPANAIPRERVRGSSYVSPVDALGAKVCTLLYGALADANRALAVRWTKRTNQALGIIVASKSNRALLLLEVEWAANMRDPSPRIVSGTQAQVSAAETVAAEQYIAALTQPASALDELEDERRMLQAELITAAKAGRAFELPPEITEDSELARLIGAPA